MNKKYLLTGIVLFVLLSAFTYMFIVMDSEPEEPTTSYTIHDNPFGFPHISEYTNARITGGLTNSNEFMTTSSDNITQCNTYHISDGSAELFEEDNGLHETGSTVNIANQSDFIITCLINERLIEDDEQQEYLFVIVEYIESTDRYNLINPVDNTEIEETTEE